MNEHVTCKAWCVSFKKESKLPPPIFKRCSIPGLSLLNEQQVKCKDLTNISLMFYLLLIVFFDC